MLPIPVCETCVENGRWKAGVYRDDVGQVLCQACDEARILARQPISGDYDRPVETEPRTYKREQWREKSAPTTSKPVTLDHHDELMKRVG